MMALSPDIIKELLNKELRALSSSAPQQSGPLRWVDKSDRCASRGCGTQTFAKVKGVPRCMKHALVELNEMLVE
jgi:hypothetical protein